jgi:hypothetical protein
MTVPNGCATANRNSDARVEQHTRVVLGGPSYWTSRRAGRETLES